MNDSTALPGAGELFAIDEFLCYQVGKSLAQYQGVGNNSAFASVSKEVQVAFKIAFVSICHQFNWDFLHSRLLSKLKVNATLEQFLAQLCVVKADEFSSWFEDYPKPERIRAKERSQFLRQVGKEMTGICGMEAGKFLSTVGKKLGGENGFLHLLDKLSAYNKDPLRKKANVLVHDLIRERILRFGDEEVVQPAVDYHIMRLYLRTGRVYPLHSATFRTLATANPSPRTRLITLLRREVSNALVLTAASAQLPIPDMNYVEWQIGRSICIKGDPFCITGAAPKDFDQDLAVMFRDSCRFSSVCRACLDAEWMKLQEPVYEKAFY